MQWFAGGACWKIRARIVGGGGVWERKKKKEREESRKGNERGSKDFFLCLAIK